MLAVGEALQMALEHLDQVRLGVHVSACLFLCACVRAFFRSKVRPNPPPPFPTSIFFPLSVVRSGREPSSTE